MDVGIFYGEIIFRKKEQISYVGVLITPIFFVCNSDKNGYTFLDFFSSVI